MEMYVGIKRAEGIETKGITVYDREGEEIHRATKQNRTEGQGKFDANIAAMTWGIRQFRMLEEQGEIEVEEKLVIYTESKTLFKWVQNGESAKPYTIPFSELMLELSLLGVETELHLIEGHLIRFREEKEELSRVVDIVGEFNVEE